MFIPVATFGRRFLRDDTVEMDCRGRLGLDEEMIGAPALVYPERRKIWSASSYFWPSQIFVASSVELCTSKV